MTGARALTAAGAALAAAVVAAAPATQVFRASVDMASFAVTVTDRKGELATGLSRADFEVLEDGRPQEIRLFARGDEPEAAPPLHLGLLFDASGSMEDIIGFSRSAAIKFLNTLREAEDITLVIFDTQVRVARYRQADFARLVERIRQRRPDGQTALYDALGVYLDGAASEDGRHVLVLYTDGGDTSSVMTFHEARGLLRASDVTVYAIGFLSHLSRSSEFEQRMRLRTLAETTGGLAFFPGAVDDLAATYATIAAEVRGQYTVGYLSSNAKADGAWRKVEIRVRRPGAKVRARQGYYAPFRQGT